MASRPELKVDDEQGFIRFFNGLNDPGPDTIRIFNRGDYYTAHGEDASFIARSVYKTTSVLRQLGKTGGGLSSVTMTVTVFRNFLRDALFKLGKRIEVWENSGRMQWKIAKQASPGNLQDIEDDLGGYLDAAPIILAVKVVAKAAEARTVGVCFADASVRELGVSEFLDNDLYSNFESLLIQLGVKECLIQANVSKKDVELAKLKSIAESCGVAVSERPTSDFSSKDVEQDLDRLLRGEQGFSVSAQAELKVAMSSASALIKYLGLLMDASNFGQYHLYQHDLSQFMKLDSAALRALNLMPGPRDGAKSMSLFGLLNHCKTPIGTRLLNQWLKQPLMSIEEIEKRHKLVEAFVEDVGMRQSMQESHLRLIPDLYRLSKRFQRKQANLEDVVRAYQVSIRLPGFLSVLEAVNDERYKNAIETTYTEKLVKMSRNLSKLQDMVETTVDLEAMDRHEFIIKSEFDEALQAIGQRLDKIKHNMEVELTKVSRDLNQEVEKKLFMENHKVHGWCFRLTRAEAACIRGKKNYEECSTQKNGVYFTTKTMAGYRRESDTLSEAYNKTQRGLVNEVVSVAASYCPVLEELAGILAHLDVIVSFAHVAAHAPTAYVRPTMKPQASGSTILKEARHPCLEMQDDVQFITNDVSLVRGESEFLIITGPNMGGKSTYIRQIGVIALMAQIGSFVPCSEAEICVFDSVLARVGASDSQLRGVSTFMAEMLETANILKSATRSSLIIIDELGRGTSTYDGFGLAWAISEYIVKNIGAYALFATHFHELTALDQHYKQVKNFHVEALITDARPQSVIDAENAAKANGMEVDGAKDGDVDARNRQVTLLYKIQPGASSQSFGIHVAELVKFPPKVIAMAKRKASELEDFSSSHAHQDESDEAKEKRIKTEELSQKFSNAMSVDEMHKCNSALKRILKEWKKQYFDDVDGGDMDVDGAGDDRKKMALEEKRRALRDMVCKDEVLQGSVFLEQVRALA